jgi:lipid-binding SYLF domain-containing protein
MKKLYIFTIMVLSAVFFLPPASMMAAGNESAKVEEATAVLSEIMRIPEKSIPPSLLRHAYAVGIVPNVIKAGLVIGGRYGTGILVVRQEDMKWSPPSFISLTGGSIGWQIGVASTDVILVFKNKKSIDKITRGKYTLGADVAVAAGPVGRSASASTDVAFRAEIYSYSRSRGIFAGVSLEGSALRIDHSANEAFYGRKGIFPKEIFQGQNIDVPLEAVNFMETLTKYTQRPLQNE